MFINSEIFQQSRPGVAMHVSSSFYMMFKALNSGRRFVWEDPLLPGIVLVTVSKGQFGGLVHTQTPAVVLVLHQPSRSKLKLGITAGLAPGDGESGGEAELEVGHRANLVGLGQREEALRTLTVASVHPHGRIGPRLLQRVQALIAGRILDHAQGLD